MWKKIVIGTLLVSSLFAYPEPYLAKEPLTYFPIVKKGDVLPWKKVSKLIPKGSTFKVIDLETGFYFRVQRRAGNQHADVQPLTHDDTAVLKHLYNGKWSWKRRAVLIPVKGRMIAGSMHGMPHGAGALENGFPGHFCIHFSGSSTHRSRNIDPSHQLMILKAGDKLNRYAAGASAKQTVSMFLIGMKQQDIKIAKPILSTALLHNAKIKDLFKGVTGLNYEIKKNNSRYPPIVRTEVSARVKQYDEDGKHNRVYRFSLERKSMTDGWKIIKIKY
ncbi:hypothetical protein [Fictibacillus phosphorivorans]|uniref:hypothetical protein n=1 Tax=Fictibacillus phosphorivorans TaxID=1221500 RepID=UPI00203F99E8|nr:hypothetical protein [Fictibacillus phosphorivorans]MCM3718211.1 hypothetical protein [Fictibacillus phosphorivorans]MCM3775922.1 hypothetical protein [Fictibacillus phosphorivorans]